MRKFIFIFLVIIPICQSNAESIYQWYRSYGDNASSRHLEIPLSDNIDFILHKYQSIPVGSKESKGPQSSPLYFNKTILQLIDGYFIAFFIDNGREKWRTYTGSNSFVRGFTIQKIGINFIGFIPYNNGVIAINLEDGKIQNNLGDSGKYKVGGSVLVPPIIRDNKIYIASLQNGVSAFELSGKKIWETSLKTKTVSPRVWSGFSYDEVSNNLFITTSNNSGIINASEEPDYSSSIIALSASNGRIRWSMQETKADVWDFDMAGSPLIVKNKEATSVVGLSKTPSIFYLSSIDGSAVLKGGLEYYCPEPLRAEMNKYCPQVRSANPLQLYNPNLTKNSLRISGENQSYIEQKIKYATLERYSIPSNAEDVVLTGLHGGVTRSGGSVDSDGKIYVSYNIEPWILRVFYVDKIYKFLQKVSNLIGKSKEEYRWDSFSEKGNNILNLYKYIPILGYNKNYYQHCASCHGLAYEGFIESESSGDKYYPSLTGISNHERIKSLDNNVNFLKIHSILNKTISETDLKIILSDIKKFIQRRDGVLEALHLLHKEGRWGLLLGSDDLPATKPPWSGITSIDLTNGQHIWTNTLGTMSSGKTVGKGALSFSGTASIGSKYIAAGAGSDSKAHILNKKDGSVVWTYRLEGPSSSVPTPFIHEGCLYIAFISGNIGFHGFSKIAPKIEIFKSNQCVKSYRSSTQILSIRK